MAVECFELSLSSEDESKRAPFTGYFKDLAVQLDRIRVGLLLSQLLLHHHDQATVVWSEHHCSKASLISTDLIGSYRDPKFREGLLTFLPPCPYA